MRVAVLVHNDVVTDARVRKGVETLAGVGYSVDVFGLRKRGQTVHSGSVEGIDNLEIIEYGSFPLPDGAIYRRLSTLKRSPFFRWLGPQLDAKAIAYRYERLAALLAEKVIQGSYDIVHCHDIIALMATSRIKAERPDTRIIWDAHEIYEDMAGLEQPRKLAIQSVIRKHQKYIDKFITINQSFAQFYHKEYRLPPATIIMNATRYNGAPRDDGRLRRAAGLSDRRKIILYQGGLSPNRGLGAIMDAAPHLPEPWSFVIMGSGKLEEEIKTVARRANQDRARGEEKLVLVPSAPYSELARWTAGADLGIIPYENVGLNHLWCTPNKLWEYPNAGVPILATRLVEMEKMISRWGTGFLLPREVSGESIVSFLVRLTEADLLEKKQNCERFSKEMSWQAFEPRLINIYRELAEAKQGHTLEREAVLAPAAIGGDAS